MKLNYFKNKVALVTGSSMGIGKAIAIELASKGAKVVLNGRNGEKLRRTEIELRNNGFDVFAVAADIRNINDCQHLVDECIKQYGELDVLVNNAGVSSRGSVEFMEEANFKILAETNFMGAAYLSKHAIPYLKKSKGHIIFINSAGGFRGMPYNSAYTISKMAQAGLVEALRIELFDYDIHVGIAFVGFTKNDPKKSILDVDGTWIYLPKRTNIPLATQESVARRVRKMLVQRKNRATLTRLGNFTEFTTRYFPRFSDWLLRINRERIQKQFTMIGGVKVKDNSI
ncbi:SDR family NAD(P)-dependent oxidoreductase [Maribacter aestuarii]|uniref:SDR family NAD(P)-dependent oxidoreductase n=1 Tax=Maribacter aestuarii TaxID=1130723 RepID=UPI00248B1587|nr:SDR family NAD(P)-dependent oxidoreductase [Maribacter aestuarii]